MKKSKKSVNLMQSEVRSIVESELRRMIVERSGLNAMDLSFIIEDAMLDGLRDALSRAVRDSNVQKSVQSLDIIDPRKTAERIATLVLESPNFKLDLVNLITVLIKKSSR